MSSPVPVLLHHRFPRGVDLALQTVAGIDLLAPSDENEFCSMSAPVIVTFRWSDKYETDELAWIQSISAGVDQFPLAQLADSGVVVTSARGVHAIPMAEHALALLLASTRGIGVAMRDASTAHWKPRMGFELAGRVVGILGLGTIGSAIASKLAALDVRVIGTRSRPELGHDVAELVFGPDETTEVFRRADAVISVLPGGAGTHHAVGEAQFAALGRGWFVNVGRGSTVDEAALIRALDDGGLRGAALDVFAEEPLPPDSPLWSHARVVLTPHTGGLSPEYGSRLAEIFQLNLKAFLGEGEWVNRAGLPPR